jgi:hypothetical protein
MKYWLKASTFQRPNLTLFLVPLAMQFYWDVLKKLIIHYVKLYNQPFVFQALGAINTG